MKSASKLIDDILTEVDDPSFTRPTVLGHLNSCNVELADKILLPDLADGSGTITTLVDDNKVDVPATFHRNIYLAQNTDGTAISVYLSLPLMIGQLGAVTLGLGTVLSLCQIGKSIYYQKVPSSATDISIMFYRTPVAMADETDEYPDGLSNNQSFEECFFHYGCWKLFKTIEQGVEGNKTDTLFHEQEYKKYRNELKLQCRKFTGAQASMPLTQKVETF